MVCVPMNITITQIIAKIIPNRDNNHVFLELFALKMIHLLSSHSFLLHFTINQELWGTLQQNPFCHTKRRKKRDEFRLPKSSLFFLKPWMNEPKFERFFVRSSTKNMRPVSLQSILVLQVKNFAT